MDPDYWRSRWREGRIGFHQEAVDSQLARFFPQATAPPPASVLVPLCGKSLDLIWLRDRGYSVTGVEIVPEACHAFVETQGLDPGDPISAGSGAFARWSSGGLTLLQGDIFDFTRSDFDSVWDRAALIALPPETRPRYAAHMLERLRPGGTILLVTAEYDPSERAGPPFTVHSDEVRDIYPGTTIEPLHRSERGEDEAARLGLSKLILQVQAIRKLEEPRPPSPGTSAR